MLLIPCTFLHSIYQPTNALSKVQYNHTHSVALVHERTIPTERPPPVGEVSANFFADRGVSRGQRNGSPRPIQIIKYNSVPKYVWVQYLSWNVFYSFYFVIFYWVHLLVDVLNLHDVIFTRPHLFCHSSSYLS